jgi:hypothetical protein
MAGQLSQQPQAQAQAEPQAQAQAQAQADEPQAWGNQEVRDLHRAAGGTFDGQTGKPIPVERNTQRASTQTWGGQSQQAQQPAQQAQQASATTASAQADAGKPGFLQSKIKGSQVPAAQQTQQEQPGFMQSKIKKGGYTYQPEMTEEMISKALAKELGDFMGKKSKTDSVLKSEKLRAADALQNKRDKAAFKKSK